MFSRRWWLVLMLFAVILSGCGGSKTGAPPADDDNPDNPGTDIPTPITVELVHEEGTTATQLIPLEGGTIQTTEERQAILNGEEPDPDFKERVQGLLGAHYHDVILPMLPKIALDCTYAESNAHKAVSWTRQVALIGAGFEAERQTVLNAVAFGMSNCGVEAIGP